MTTENECREAKVLINDARIEGLFPTVEGVGIGPGNTQGDYSVTIREAKETKFPPTYHPDLVKLLTDHGFGDVEVTYRHYNDPKAQ